MNDDPGWMNWEDPCYRTGNEVPRRCAIPLEPLPWPTHDESLDVARAMRSITRLASQIRDEREGF